MIIGSMNLKSSLLDSDSHLERPPADLNAWQDIRGRYIPFQFVLRLSPEIHRKLDSLSNGVFRGSPDFDTLQACSTYLHETVHWWQHIGSTAGFVRSMSYPAQSHVNFKHLRHLLRAAGPKKSIRELGEMLPESRSPETPGGLANTIVNNHFDIEFYRLLTHSPAWAQEVIQSPYFECIGHSFAVTYANVLFVLASTCDETFNVIPDPRPWEKEFARLRSSKEEGFYFGSDFKLAELGVREIFEGQARFAQLQYLHFVSNGKLEWDAFRSAGMLKGLYIQAFEAFLRGTQLAWPPSINHPTVALFMLVCDIATNPGEGFPMPLLHPAAFFTDADPGMRFIFLCSAIANEGRGLTGAISSYSKSEYYEIADALTRPLLVESPQTIADTFHKWKSESESLRLLMAEHQKFDFGPRNQSVRLLLAHFLSFYSDKLTRPEVFCWPGAWLAGDRLSSDIFEVFERHTALFVNKADDDSVFPRMVTGKEESLVYEAFNSFYSFNVTYDMTRQWIVTPGPFKYDYGWLSLSGSPNDYKGFADRHFEMAYGIAPDSFEILQKP